MKNQTQCKKTLSFSPTHSTISFYSSLVLILNKLQNNIPRLLDALARADDLNRLVAIAAARNLDPGARLLADAVDLAATRTHDIPIELGVGEDEVTGARRLALLFHGLLQQGLRLGDVLRVARAEDPRDVAVLAVVRGRQVVDNVPGVRVLGRRRVVGDEGRVAAGVGADVAGASGCGLGRGLLAGVVDGDAEVVAEAAEELAVVGNGVVKTPGDLDSLALLLLDHAGDVLLGLLDVLGLTDDLDLAAGSTGGSLLGNIDGNLELGLQVATSLTATTNEDTVLLRSNLDELSDLAIARADEAFDSGHDLVDDSSVTLDADRVVLRLGTGEANHAGKLTAVIGATGVDDDVANVGT